MLRKVFVTGLITANISVLGQADPAAEADKKVLADVKAPVPGEAEVAEEKEGAAALIEKGEGVADVVEEKAGDVVA